MDASPTLAGVKETQHIRVYIYILYSDASDRVYKYSFFLSAISSARMEHPTPEARIIEAGLAAALSRPLLDVLQELRRLRVADSQGGFVGILDKRQQLLNLSLILETFLQLITSWLGTLAFVWATVVLLGGFSTALIRIDFWFTTAILFIEATKYVI